MNWFELTLADGSKTLIDMSKVLRIDAIADGSRLSFNLVATNRKNRTVFKALAVKESPAEILKRLKAIA